MSCFNSNRDTPKLPRQHVKVEVLKGLKAGKEVLDGLDYPVYVSFELIRGLTGLIL